MTGGHRLRCLFLALAGFVVAGCGPDPVITAGDGSVMVLIPEGAFPMGGREEEVSQAADGHLLTYVAERPEHEVHLSAYYLDKHEVTNAQYRRFLDDVAAHGRKWSHPDQPEHLEHRQRYLNDDLRGDRRPAVGLNWYDAYAYCQWAGKRLPTEAEWEYAARGREYRQYPWGDEHPYSSGIWWANYRPRTGHEQDGHAWTAPVGSYPDGVSPFGIMDMAGNAEEWVQDWYAVYYYRQLAEARDPTGAKEVIRDPAGPSTGTKKVVKGGSYKSPSHQVRIAMRAFGKPPHKGPRIGFRCAMDP